MLEYKTSINQCRLNYWTVGFNSTGRLLCVPVMTNPKKQDNLREEKNALLRSLRDRGMELYLANDEVIRDRVFNPDLSNVLWEIKNRVVVGRTPNDIRAFIHYINEKTKENH